MRAVACSRTSAEVQQPEARQLQVGSSQDADCAGMSVRELKEFLGARGVDSSKKLHHEERVVRAGNGARGQAGGVATAGARARGRVAAGLRVQALRQDFRRAAPPPALHCRCCGESVCAGCSGQKVVLRGTRGLQRACSVKYIHGVCSACVGRHARFDALPPHKSNVALYYRAHPHDEAQQSPAIPPLRTTGTHPEG